MFKVTNNADAAIDRKNVAELMLEDYEKIIFYLMRKLGFGEDLDEINVRMLQGNHHYEFKIKKPSPYTVDGIIPSHVHSLEYAATV